jgi:hypothetical protein
MSILFYIVVIPPVMILIADEIAHKNSYFNRIRLGEGLLAQALNNKPLSCSPCLSFWLTVIVVAVASIAGDIPNLAFFVALPFLVFFVNRMR